MTTITGDLNHVTADGDFLGDIRMVDGPVSQGDLIVVADLFSDETNFGVVSEITVDGQVIVSISVRSSVFHIGGHATLTVTNSRTYEPSSTMATDAAGTPELV